MTFFNREVLFKNMSKIKNLNGIVARKEGKIVGWAILKQHFIVPCTAPLYADSFDIATQLLINLVNRIEPNHVFAINVPE